MYLKMNPKTILDNTVAFISGVYGMGMTYTLHIIWTDEAFKLIVAGVTALIGGGMGVAGKYLAVWGWKQIKSFLKK